MSEKKCCVPNCGGSRESHSVLHFFPNPENDRERFNSWLDAIGGEVSGLAHDYIFRCRRVCHDHFEEKYCCRNDRISNIALPTRNLPDPLTLQSAPSTPSRSSQEPLTSPASTPSSSSQEPLTSPPSTPPCSSQEPLTLPPSTPPCSSQEPLTLPPSTPPCSSQEPLTSPNLPTSGKPLRTYTRKKKNLDDSTKTYMESTDKCDWPTSGKPLKTYTRKRKNPDDSNQQTFVENTDKCGKEDEDLEAGPSNSKQHLVTADIEDEAGDDSNSVETVSD